MIRKSIMILVSVVLILSIFTFPVSAKSNDNANSGTPFQDLWDAITGINEEIDDLQEQVSGIANEQEHQESSPHPVIIQAHREIIEATTSAGWVEIFEYQTAQTVTIQDVQAYCSDAASNARVDIRGNGTSLIIAQPLIGGQTVSSPILQPDIVSGTTISVVSYTDQPESYINNLTVSILFEIE